MSKQRGGGINPLPIKPFGKLSPPNHKFVVWVEIVLVDKPGNLMRPEILEENMPSFVMLVEQLR